MKRFFIGLAAIYVIAVCALYLIAWAWPEVNEAYRNQARGPVFSAFITIGSFLLTLKTALLQRLKDGFDCKEHQESYVQYRRSGKSGAYYYSLANISHAIDACVPLSFLSSGVQFTVGAFTAAFATAICISLPLTTLLLVLYLWCEMARAHHLWLNRIEFEKQQELKGALEPEK